MELIIVAVSTLALAARNRLKAAGINQKSVSVNGNVDRLVRSCPIDIYAGSCGVERVDEITQYGDILYPTLLQIIARENSYA